jgi:tetratricopeptide (TPR) repeat protein
MFNLLTNYCKLMLKLGKVAKAKEIAEEAYKEYEKEHGIKNPLVLNLICIYSSILTKLEKYQIALVLLKNALIAVNELNNPHFIRIKYEITKELAINLEKTKDKSAILVFYDAVKLIDPNNYLEKMELYKSITLLHLKQQEVDEAMKNIQLAE